MNILMYQYTGVERKRSMSVIGKILGVMDMESHDVKMANI
jgi:hypothetical protein